MKLLANKRALAVVAALGLVASLLVWTLSRGDELGEMRVQADKGTVEIERDGSLIRVGGQNPVEPGDVVSTAEGSFATVRLERDRLIYLGPRTSVEILGGSGVAGEMGTFVADAPDDPLRIALGDSVGRSDGGTFRVDVDLGTTRAASYLGSLQLSAPGSPDLRLGTLWQTTITAGQLFGREPYELREKDHWDADFLDSVVELDDRLTQLKLSFTPLVGRSLPNLEYFGALVGQKGEGMSFLRSYTDKLSRKRPGYTVDIMLGLTLARAADGRLGSNFERVFGYRQQGAT